MAKYGIRGLVPWETTVVSVMLNAVDSLNLRRLSIGRSNVSLSFSICSSVSSYLHSPFRVKLSFTSPQDRENFSSWELNTH